MQTISVRILTGLSEDKATRKCFLISVAIPINPVESMGNQPNFSLNRDLLMYR